MHHGLRRPKGILTISLTALFVLASLWVLQRGGVGPEDLTLASEMASRRPTGQAQLISTAPWPGMDGEMCQWVPASSSQTILAALKQQRMEAAARAADAGSGTPTVVDRAPLRTIRDTYATFSAVTVNLKTNEMIVQDENLFQILVYDREASTPENAAFTEPKRIIEGPDTHLEFQCGIYVDQDTGDIYSVANDTTDKLLIFDGNAKGNMSPKRILHTPHGTYGIAVNEERQEMYFTVEHVDSVVVYPKSAEGEDQPIRTLEGPSTRLADPHGVALDTKNGLMFVSNHGNAQVPGQNAGRFDPPSITVYPIDANGDVAPLRIIAGSRTRLNWPAAMAFDPVKEELYVANDADHSVLVFKMNDNGNVVPTRTIRGPNTFVQNPTGIFLDQKNREMVVSNMGNHSVTSFTMDADGDMAPKRIVRSAPLGKTALAIGNPGAVGYDTTREEVLVPN